MTIRGMIFFVDQIETVWESAVPADRETIEELAS
jgi:hypothetical protein